MRREISYIYGSPPIGNYDYIAFMRHLAPALPADDKVFLYNNSTVWRENPNQIPLELFRNICHWKSWRRFQDVLKNPAEVVNKQWQRALQELDNTPYEAKATRKAFNHLTQLKGVAVPIASALLTAWNPSEFSLFDYKVLKVLDMPIRYSIRTYIQYQDRLQKLKIKYKELNNCTLRQIEFALWNYYSIQESSTKKRPK